jgi:hypothetical protein
MPKSDLERALAEFRSELLQRERAAASVMVRTYGQAWQRLKAQLDSLDTEYQAAKSRGEQPGPGWIYEYNRARAFRDQVERELNWFAQYAEQSTRTQMQAAIAAAQEHAERLTRAALGRLPPGVVIPWNRISTAAVEQMVALTQPDSPLHKLLLSISAEGTQAAEDALINGLLMGFSPRKTAPLLRKALGVPLSRALTISRTETLRAYRESSRESYRANSDIVQGWVWHSACDARTCAMCVTEETIVSGPSIQKVFSRHYTGDIVIIKTASGKYLAVTPNHPIFTDSGWVKAGLLKEGDYVISSADADGASVGIGIDNYQMPTIIKNVSESLGMISTKMPCSTPYFHGDGKKSNVYVVWANLLKSNINPFSNKHIEQNNFARRRMWNLPIFSFLFPFFCCFPSLFECCFIWAGMIIKNWFSLFQRNSGTSGNDSFSECSSWCVSKTQTSRYCMSAYAEGFGKFLLSLSSKVSGRNLILRKIQLVMAKAAVLFSGNRIALRFISEQAALFENGSEALSANTKSWSNFLGSFSSEISLDCILNVNVKRFSGHVYNLQTNDGWYFANGIITHNCWAMHGTVHSLDERLDDHPNGRCVAQPLTRSWSDLGKRFGFDGSDIPETRIEPEPGAEVFARLPAEQQIKILGPAKWAAWKDGRFQFADLVGRKHSPVWGWMRHERSLQDIVGVDAAKGYTRLALMQIAEHAPNYPADDLIKMAGLGLRDLTPAELSKVVQHVASAGFSTDLEKCGTRIAGLIWDGNLIRSTDRLPTGVVHYLRHAIYGQEWPPGTSINDYYASLRAAITDPEAKIAVSKYGDFWHLGFSGSDGTWVDYRVQYGYWVTGLRPESLEKILSSLKRSFTKWLR